jgi:hypothetical protein
MQQPTKTSSFIVFLLCFGVFVFTFIKMSEFIVLKWDGHAAEAIITSKSVVNRKVSFLGKSFRIYYEYKDQYGDNFKGHDDISYPEWNSSRIDGKVLIVYSPLLPLSSKIIGQSNKEFLVFLAIWLFSFLGIFVSLTNFKKAIEIEAGNKHFASINK